MAALIHMNNKILTIPISFLLLLTFSELNLARDIFVDHEMNIIKQRSNLDRSNKNRKYQYIELNAHEIKSENGLIDIGGFDSNENTKNLDIAIKIKGNINGDELSIGNSDLGRNVKKINTNIIIDGNIEAQEEINIGNIQAGDHNIDSLEINTILDINGNVKSGN